MSLQSIMFNDLVAKLEGGLKETIDVIEALQYIERFTYKELFTQSDE